MKEPKDHVKSIRIKGSIINKLEQYSLEDERPFQWYVDKALEIYVTLRECNIKGKL